VVATELRLPQVGPPVAYSETATTTHQAQHPPGYYFLCAPLFRLLRALSVSPWTGLRLFSLLIGAATVVVVWRIGRLLFPEGSTAVALSATTGMVPMFQYMTAMINNIGLAILFVALAAHRMAVILRGRDDRRQWAILGIILGLASLTSLMGLALCLVPMGLLAMRARALGAREALLRLAAVVGGPAALAGWWFARNYVVHGALTPMFRGQPAMVVGLPTVLLGDPMAALLSVGIILNNGLIQLWSCAWLMRETGAPMPALVLLRLVAYVGFALFVAGVVRAGRSSHAALRSWATIAVLAFLIVLGGVVRQAWYVDLQVAGFVGRYFVILLPLCLPLAAWGLDLAQAGRLSVTRLLAASWAFLILGNAAHAAYVVWFFQRY
jgi:hypothetical protein